MNVSFNKDSVIYEDGFVPFDMCLMFLLSAYYFKVLKQDHKEKIIQVNKQSIHTR